MKKIESTLVLLAAAALAAGCIAESGEPPEEGDVAIVAPSALPQCPPPGAPDYAPELEPAPTPPALDEPTKNDAERAFGPDAGGSEGSYWL